MEFVLIALGALWLGYLAGRRAGRIQGYLVAHYLLYEAEEVVGDGSGCEEVSSAPPPAMYDPAHLARQREASRRGLQ